jgi:hypothetical protein
VDITSFRKYPTPEGRPPDDAVSRRRVRLWTDLARFALVLAFLGADRWALADIEQARDVERMRSVERDRLEHQSRDPVWVYECLAERYVLDDLDIWCGLTVTPASADEVTRLNAAAYTTDPRGAIRDSLATWTMAELSRLWPSSELEWYKLHDPAAPNRWIGVAVRKRDLKDRSSRSIGCRVRMGF